MRKVFILLAALLMGGATNPHDLPSLKIAWEWPHDTQGLDVRADRVYVLGETSVSCIDALNGHLYWEKNLGKEDVYANGIVAAPHAIAVGIDKSIVLLDPRTGTILHTIDLAGTVMNLWGPALLAEVSPEESSSEL